MKIVSYKSDDHYPFIYKWWRIQNGRVLDPAQISDDGAVAFSDDGDPVAASWLYFGNSQLAHIGFTVANPASGPKEKVKAIKALIDFLVIKAREVGMRYIVSNSDRTALNKLFQKAGFVEMEQHTSLALQLPYKEYADQGLL